MLIDKITAKLEEQDFVNSFIENPDEALKKEFNMSLENVMKEISGNSESYENFMKKLASVMDVEFLTAAASSCCS